MTPPRRSPKHPHHRFALACALVFACGMASAQDMRPPPPPGQPPPPPNGMPPPPPPFGANAAQNGQRPFPPPPPPLQQSAQQIPPQQQQSQPQPQPQQPTVVPVPIAVTNTAAASPVPSSTKATVSSPPSESAEIPHATIDPEAAKWSQETPAPVQAHSALNPSAAQSPVATAPIERIVEMIPVWVWGVALALPILLLLLSYSVRRQMRLENETQQLARQRRVLQAEQRGLRDASEQLRQQAINDPLTGVLNRRAFADELRKLLDHLSRFGRPLNLIVFDLDHFKAINDQQGHLAGDIALKLVAGVVHRHLNSDDLFGRFGGDEFLIACADRSLDETAQLAESIRRAVVDESTTCKPPLPGLSLSIGIARASPESGYFVDALFQRADTALYAAKHGGRNRVVLASDDLPRPPASEAVARQLA